VGSPLQHLRALRIRAPWASLLWLAACGSGEPPAPPTPEVLVVDVAQRDVPIVSEWLGTTEGYVDADIRAQVAGYLISRDYQEGQLVSSGDLLFKIDPRPFQAALDQARAELGRAEASLALARQDVNRYTPLVSQGAVSRQEYDVALQRQRSGEADVKAAHAAIEKAQIDLGFTEIRSPIDGIVGVAVRQRGDFVGPADAKPLTTVSQIDPIRVSFSVSEQFYLQHSELVREAVRKRSFREQLILADGSIYPHRRTGYPAGREVDPTTGSITVKGVFPNPDFVLRPGQFARIRVEVDTVKGALVVPQRAVQETQGIAQLTLVSADGKIEVRTVKTGTVWGTLEVITEGVSAGERVVVEGFQKVRPGQNVDVKPAPVELAGAPPPSVAVAAPPTGDHAAPPPRDKALPPPSGGK
jgi:membrane fusion protein, multidrug efflux system